MSPDQMSFSQTVSIALRDTGVVLLGDLTLPEDPTGLVVFAHGSGSSRLSSRNRDVATSLVRGGFGTLLFDLLTKREDAVDAVSAQLRFNIELLGGRLVGVTDWLEAQRSTRGLRLGYFGASTGAAAALMAAAMRPDRVDAVVSRGGRPDLAGTYLEQVRAPTLLIVGGHDTAVIGMNRTALQRLGTATKELAIVPRAGHLFEEPGALERVARLARDWFTRHLAIPSGSHAQESSGQP